LEKEELILRNTYANSQMGPIVPHQPGLFKPQDKVKWVDEAMNIALAKVANTPQKSKGLKSQNLV
jgi:hypothetical protein